ncbi:MAG: ankyrin repeat domain-containing protein [Bdellovibrionales bacterium]|nr:ankyrin repeat domain-containing protein [Bdellovibrionales bacterium]
MKFFTFLFDKQTFLSFISLKWRGKKMNLNSLNKTLFKIGALLLFLVNFHVNAEELHKATFYCDYESISDLLNNKANVNEIDHHGNTALHYAYMKECDEDVLNLLLSQQEIDTNIKNNDGEIASEVKPLKTCSMGIGFGIPFPIKSISIHCAYHNLQIKNKYY